MNVSFSISTPNFGTTQTSGTTQTQQTSQENRTLTVSITSGGSQTQGTSSTPVTLSYPLIGPEDIALNEVQQDLQNLNLSSLKASTLTAAVLLVNDQMNTLATQISNGGKEYLRQNSAALTENFTKMEEQARKTETQLFDMLNSGNYPDFAEFLGKMLTAAQELRQLASEAKHHMVMAQYENVLEQAKQMQVAAEKNYASTMKEIEASRTEAIASIVSGAVSILGTAGGGIVGMRTPSAGGVTGAQLGSGIGQALGQIASGIGGVVSAGMKETAAGYKLEADMAGVTQKKYEATLKLLQEAESITDELMNIGKTLSDMVLKLYQDFLSSQNQILQRSNI